MRGGGAPNCTRELDKGLVLQEVCLLLKGDEFRCRLAGGSACELMHGQLWLASHTYVHAR